MTDTINNQIHFVPENTIDPAAGLNLSLNTIDALLQVLVQTVGANTPPAGFEGQRFIVGTAPTGAWAGQANKLARFLDGAWQFFSARYVLNAADGFWYVRSASAWSALAGGGGGEANTASNLGAGEGLYASKVGVDLRFKSLVAGTNVSLSSDGDTVTIDATGGGGGSGTVTSVALSAPTGFDVSGSPVTASGTLALSFSTGYSLPTNANQANWSAAFGWGDHALAGYEKQLVAGANITIDRTNPLAPIISSSAAGGGGGDVVGPASAVNNGVALFDGTSGKLLKDGGALGSAAFTASTAYATAAQGTLAGTALQPAAIGVSVQGYSANLTAWAGLATSDKQDTLVSATNIKTINGASIVGPGNLIVGGGITVGTAINTNSGTSHDFSGIPAGAKRIQVFFHGLRTSGSSPVQIQIGAGAVQTTGYVSSSAATIPGGSAVGSQSTTGVVFAGGGATSMRTGCFTLRKISGNTWVSDLSGAFTDGSISVGGAGYVTLSGELDRIRLTTISGADSFTAGSINISYEF